MSRTTDGMTAEQLAGMPDDGNRYELVEGVLRMMSPAGFRHGRIAAKLLRRIGTHVEEHGLGETSAAETGFLVGRHPDTVLAPDIAFVSSDRLRPYFGHVGYLPLAPDLVAEVVSPSDRASEIEAKVQAWLNAGARLVLVVAPQDATVREYRPDRPVDIHASGSIDLDDVVTGFRLDVAELFV